MMKRKLSIVFSLFLAIGILAPVGIAQTTGFTYQGSLNSGGVVANGNHDFEFALFDAVSGGAQLGATITQSSVSVTNGIFAVSLDFGSQFPGAGRFFEIRVRPTGGGAFTPLTPRQAVNSTPYSVKSLNADTATTATNAAQLGGVAANQFVVTTDPRMTDDRNPLTGSANYIQNTAVQQPASNFNISGTGTASIFAATQFNIGANRILSSAGINNLFAGAGSGSVNTAGQANSFFGRSSGLANTTGDDNSFFGSSSGLANTTGQDNSFFGRSSGQANTIGRDNSFVGSDSGSANTTGNSNSFFGRSSGFANTTGFSNSFFGKGSGEANTSGFGNSFFGNFSGAANTTASENSFFGGNSGFANTTGDDNSFFGQNSGFANTIGTDNSFFGKNSGFSNTVGFRNSFFGRSSGVSNTTGSDNSFFGSASGNANTTGGDNSFFGFEAGKASTVNNNSFFGSEAGRVTTTGASNSFFGKSAGELNTTASFGAFFGASAGFGNTTGTQNTFIGVDAGVDTTTGGFNTFVGTSAGETNVIGTNNTVIGNGADISQNNFAFATAIGSNAVVTAGSRVQLGRNGSDTVRIGDLAAATATQLCITADSVLAACSSSARYKENIQPFASGLDLIKRFRPVTFDWIERKEPDLGLIAEEVAGVEPLLVTYNRNGEIQGVKYDRIGVLLINAVKEQQQQIEVQQKQIDEQSETMKTQQAEIDALKVHICSQNPSAAFCKPKTR